MEEIKKIDTHFIQTYISNNGYKMELPVPDKSNSFEDKKRVVLCELYEDYVLSINPNIKLDDGLPADVKSCIKRDYKQTPKQIMKKFPRYSLKRNQLVAFKTKIKNIEMKKAKETAPINQVEVI